MYQGINKYRVKVLTPQNRKVTRIFRGKNFKDIKEQLKNMSLRWIGNFEYVCNNDQINHTKKHKGKHVNRKLRFY